MRLLYSVSFKGGILEKEDIDRMMQISINLPFLVYKYQNIRAKDVLLFTDRIPSYYVGGPGLDSSKYQKTLPRPNPN